MQAWQRYEQAVLSWLIKTSQNRSLSEDICQEIFIRLMMQEQKFCAVADQQAWLFRVAQNLLIDHQRKDRFQAMEEDVIAEQPDLDPVDLLALQCLPRVLTELTDEDREIISACDIERVKQSDYAAKHQLSLPATKARLRRARSRLKQQMLTACKVTFDENKAVCCFTPRTKNK